ncbi:MAG TPA: metallophosphoesterase [Acidobacteriaceae bacterium]
MIRFPKTLLLPLLLTLCSGVITAQVQPATSQASAPEMRFALKDNAVRWAVIGDNGTGEAPEQAVANQMQRYWTVAHFDFVTMDGDNIYGGHRPSDFHNKFELPYKPLLDEGVKFYACLGNHDDPGLEENYKPFSMGGNRYYTFRKGDVQFFVLDSNYMDPAQLDWLTDKLKSSDAGWKIAYFHHPLYTAAAFHGPDVDLRNQLMPLFQQYGVNAVWSGHEHVYEHLKPQDGINFFLVGNSGELRFNNIRKPNDLDIVGFDTDRTFMLVQIAGNQLDYQTISAAGKIVDSGALSRQNKPAALASSPGATK